MIATFQRALCISIRYTLSDSSSYVLGNPKGVCCCRILDYMGNKVLDLPTLWLHHCFYLSRS